MGVVAFDPTYWGAAFPEFSTISLTLVETVYWTIAGQLCDNSGCGPITDTSVGGTLYIALHLLTAHITKLRSGDNSGPASPLVGRVSDAAEGSVSVSTENAYPEGTVQWYQQTPYGALYWTMTASYRSAIYVPGPLPLQGAFFSGLYGGAFPGNWDF